MQEDELVVANKQAWKHELLGYSFPSTELRATTEERSSIMPRLHEHLKSAYLHGVSGEETADAHFRECGLLTERSRRSLQLEHLSKIGSPATCSGAVISLSQAQTEEGQWKGVKNGKAPKGGHEWRLEEDALIAGETLGA